MAAGTAGFVSGRRHDIGQPAAQPADDGFEHFVVLASLVECRRDDADRQDRQHARNGRMRRAVPGRASRPAMVSAQLAELGNLPSGRAGIHTLPTSPTALAVLSSTGWVAHLQPVSAQYRRSAHTSCRKESAAPAPKPAPQSPIGIVPRWAHQLRGHRLHTALGRSACAVACIVVWSY